MEKRASNIELLRVISMIMITMGHLGGAYIVENSVDVYDRIISEWTVGVTGVGLSCYALITGYFSYKKFDSNLKGVIKTHHIVVFYCLLTYVLGNIVGSEPQSILCNFFPVLTAQYWYISLFIIIMLLRPYISKMLYALSVREHIFFAVFIWLLECGGLTLARFGIFGGVPILVSCYLGSFLALIIIGNLLARLNYENLNKRTVAIGSLGSMCIMFLIPLLCEFVAVKTGLYKIADVAVPALLQMSPITSVIAIVWFIWFSKINIPYNVDKQTWQIVSGMLFNN